MLWECGTETGSVGPLGIVQICVSRLWAKLEKKENLKIHTHTSLLAGERALEFPCREIPRAALVPAPFGIPLQRLCWFGPCDTCWEQRLPVAVHSPSSEFCSEHWRSVTSWVLWEPSPFK